MFHPSRGGVRGGKDQFKWEDVKTDKDRECYLGHSVMAPVGRWQEGKDITWYATKGEKGKAKAAQEFLRVKEMEEKALMAALGYRVVEKTNNEEDEAVSSKNVHSESEEDEKHVVGVRGPQTFDPNDKKEIDNVLKKLIKKNGLAEVFEALGSDYKAYLKELKKKEKKSEKSNKKEKSKKKKKSESEETEDERDKRKDKEKNSSKSKRGNDRREDVKCIKRKRHSSNSGSSRTSSESD